MSKDWDTRWGETIKYLDAATTSGRVGTHIQSIITNPDKRKEISKELSLGWRSDGEDDPGFDAKTDKRHALRALLLCQRVYYGDDTWAKCSEAIGNMETVDVKPVKDLIPKWKTASLSFWKTKSEADIREGIKMFEIVPGATAVEVQTAAYTGAPNGTPLPGNLTVSRTDTDTVGAGIICYVGVQGWLVRSGVVSMRWFEQNSSPNGKKGCDLLFGSGNLVWDKPIMPSDLPQVKLLCRSVPAGHVVHIWSPQNYNWNGHWLISNGNGTICGVNNGEIKASEAEDGKQVQKNYTKSGTLFDQFVGYSVPYPNDASKRTRACMAIMDPLTMPSRM
jgi:hypothetical protein